MKCSKMLDLTNISKELKLQLQFLKMKNEEDINQLDNSWFTDIDWEEFIALAIHHRTFCTLYKTMKQITKVGIPDNVIQRLGNLYKKNIFNMLQLSAEMENINKIMIEEKLRFLLLKGPALGKHLYGDISLRTSCDLDILVPLKELQRVEQLLQKEGYVKDNYIRSILDDWKWRHHHVTFLHPVKGVKLEIHWRLNPGPGSEPSFDELWKRKKSIQITKTPLFLLGNEDLFLFLASHGARHGWSRLRWLLDIHEIMKRNNLNFNRLNSISKKYNYAHLLGQSIRLVSECFNIQVPDLLLVFNNNKRAIRLAECTAYYLENKVNLHTYPVPVDVAQYHRKYLFKMKTPLQKIIFILSFLYPYPEDQDILPLPKRLHFLYFPLRPILWLCNKLGLSYQVINREIFK